MYGIVFRKLNESFLGQEKSTEHRSGAKWFCICIKVDVRVCLSYPYAKELRYARREGF